MKELVFLFFGSLRKWLVHAYIYPTDTACCLNVNNNRWNKFDDHEVLEAKQSNIKVRKWSSAVCFSFFPKSNWPYIVYNMFLAQLVIDSLTRGFMRLTEQKSEQTHLYTPIRACKFWARHTPCRLDSSPNCVPPPENYCFLMFCIPKPVQLAGQVAWYVNVFVTRKKGTLRKWMNKAK